MFRYMTALVFFWVMAPAGLMVDRTAIETAVNHPSRPAEDRQRDAGRKPIEILDFCGIEPGMRVAELMAGSGWYTEILSRRVGPEGRGWAHNNRISARNYGKELNRRLGDNRLENVTAMVRPLTDLELPPRSLDAVLLFLFYHDTYWMGVDRAAMNRHIHSRLKPGGIFCVTDHRAEPGSGARDVKSLHRIDADQVKREILTAGFILDGESDLLRNPNDDRTQGVFELRGRTDRFVYRFIRPMEENSHSFSGGR